MTVRTRRFPIPLSPSSLFLEPKINTNAERRRDGPGARSEAVCIIGELSCRGNGGAGAFARPWLAFPPRALFSFPGGAASFLALRAWSVASRSLFAPPHWHCPQPAGGPHLRCPVRGVDHGRRAG